MFNDVAQSPTLKQINTGRANARSLCTDFNLLHSHFLHSISRILSVLKKYDPSRKWKQISRIISSETQVDLKFLQIHFFENYTIQHHPVVLSLIRFSDVIFCWKYESDFKISLSRQDSKIFWLKCAKNTFFWYIWGYVTPRG